MCTLGRHRRSKSDAYEVRRYDAAKAIEARDVDGDRAFMKLATQPRPLSRAFGERYIER